MLGKIRTTTPRALFFLGVYFVLIKLLIFLIVLFFPSERMLAYTPFFNIDLPWTFLIAMLCIIAQAAWMNRILSNIPFIPERTYFVPGIFVLLTSMTVEMNTIRIPLLLNFLNIGIIAQLVKMSFHESANSESFKVGFLLGLWVMFEPSVIFLIPFIVVAIYLLKPFRFNELILLTIGAFLPAYFSAGISYVLEVKWLSPFDSSLIGFFRPTFTLLSLQPILLVLLFCLFAVFHYRINFTLLSTLQKRLSSALSIIFLGTVAAIIFSMYKDWSVLHYIIPISSVFIAIYLLRITNKIRAEIIHAIFVLIIFFNQFLKFLQ